MQIEQVTRQGIGAWNEDAVVESPDRSIYGVLDGITSLTKWRAPDGMTGGAVASAVVKRYIETCPPEQSLAEMVVGANKRLREEMESHGIDADDPGARWGCAGALVKIGPTYVEHCHAGDSLVYALYGDGEIRELTRDSVDPFERRSLEAFEQNGRVRDEKMIRTLRANRGLANTAAGYTAINGDPALADFLEFGRVNRQGLEAVLVVSDGLTWPEPLPHEERYRRMVTEIFARGLAGYADHVIELENSDPEMVRYPRLKHADDKTGILIRLHT